MLVKRNIVLYLRELLKKFPIISVTGPRQSGKTTMLRAEFPEYEYFNLERVDHREMISADPLGFLKSAGQRVIFDEAQNIPELFSYIQVISDEKGIPGQYILSGSQSFLLNEKISQSLAGRAGIVNLFPFDISEMSFTKDNDYSNFIFKGFYPRIYDKNISPLDFYPFYLQTYIERDIRTLKNIENLSSFSRFLHLCAGRVGQILNLSSLANDAGISVNTAKAWLSLLEASFVVYLLKPYYKNFNKRLIKAPKLYFYDTGVAASLLKITSPEMVKNHFAYGQLFENLIISEIIKTAKHSGKNITIYYWRESNGTEIDAIIDKGNGTILAIEIKGGETFSNDFLKNLRKLSPGSEKIKIEKKLIYAGEINSFVDEIEVISWKKFKSSVTTLLD